MGSRGYLWARLGAALHGLDSHLVSLPLRVCAYSPQLLRKLYNDAVLVATSGTVDAVVTVETTSTGVSVSPPPLLLSNAQEVTGHHCGCVFLVALPRCLVCARVDWVGARMGVDVRAFFVIMTRGHSCAVRSCW